MSDTTENENPNEGLETPDEGFDLAEPAAAPTPATPETPALELAREDLELLAAKTGIGVEKWEPDDQGKQAPPMSFDFAKKEVIWQGQALSEVLKGADVIQKYNETREQLAQGQTAIWNYRNEKGEMEGIVYKIDDKGNVSSYVLKEKEPEVPVELNELATLETGSGEPGAGDSANAGSRERTDTFSIFARGEKTPVFAVARVETGEGRHEWREIKPGTKTEASQSVFSLMRPVTVERPAAVPTSIIREIFTAKPEQPIMAVEAGETVAVEEETGIRIVEMGAHEVNTYLNIDSPAAVQSEPAAGFSPLEFFAPPAVVAAPEEFSGISLVEMGSSDPVTAEPVVSSEFSFVETVATEREEVSPKVEYVPAAVIERDQNETVNTATPEADMLVFTEDQPAISIQSVEAAAALGRTESEIILASEITAPVSAERVTENNSAEPQVDMAQEIMNTAETAGLVQVEPVESAEVSTDLGKTVLEQPAVEDGAITLPVAGERVSSTPEERTEIRTAEPKGAGVRAEPQVREAVAEKAAETRPQAERAPISIRTAERVIVSEPVQEAAPRIVEAPRLERAPIAAPVPSSVSGRVAPRNIPAERPVRENARENVDARVSFREVPVGTSATLFRQESRRSEVEAAPSARVIDNNAPQVFARPVSESLQRNGNQSSVADIVDIQEELDLEPQLSAVAA